jgi:hypothetical protein
MEVNNIIEALEPKLKGYKDELSGRVAEVSEKVAADVAQLNEDAAKKGESIAELKAKVDALTAKSGKLAGAASEKAGWSNSEHMKAAVMDIVADNYDNIKSERPFTSMKQVGTMTLTDNLTGTSQISYVQNPIMRSFFQPHLYDVFRIVPTGTGNVTFPRGKTPVGTGSFGAQTEGSAKAQVDYDLEMVNVSVPFIAGYARVSRQMLQDLPFLQSYLSQSLIEDWNRAVNVRFRRHQDQRRARRSPQPGDWLEVLRHEHQRLRHRPGERSAGEEHGVQRGRFYQEPRHLPCRGQDRTLVFPAHRRSVRHLRNLRIRSLRNLKIGWSQFSRPPYLC